MVSSRQHLTIYEKNELRRYHLANPSLTYVNLQQWVAVHLEKSIGVSTVGKFINQPLDSTPNDNVKKKRKPRHASIETELMAFVHAQEAQGLLSDEVLRTKANELVGEETISLSWIQRFKARHGVTLHKMHGEAGSVDIADLGQHSVLSHATKSNGWQPKRSQEKKDKARISIVLCCNLTGTEKLEPIVINRAAKPRYFRGSNIDAIPMEYFSNQKAWMTTDVFFKWVRALNLKMHGRKILLLLDNAPGHVDIELDNVHTHILPKNTTSHLQPKDAGIIRNFKLKYKKLFVRWVIEQTGPQKRLDLLTSIKYVVDAWGAVSEATIRHCWRHTRIVSGSISSRVERHSELDRETDLGDLEQLISRLNLVDALSAVSYISVEDAVKDSVDSDDSYEHSSSDSDCVGWRKNRSRTARR